MEKLQQAVDLFTNIAHRLIAQANAFMIEGENLGQGLFIIDLIARKPDCTMKDIVETFALTPSTATRHVDKLVEEGLIDRNLSIFDRRNVVLFLTKKGEDVRKLFLKHRMDRFSSVLESMSSKDQRILIEQLERIAEVVR